MTKVNKPGSRKPGMNNSKTADTKKPGSGAAGGSRPSLTPKSPQSQSSSSQSTAGKGKQDAKDRKSTIGGTAISGAKSTQPREIKSTNPAQQQAESYNREMRRRMQHMGTGPYSEGPGQALRDKRQKRLDKRKQRQEEVKKEVVTRGPSTDVRLGRRNTYFLIAVIAIIVLIIVIALIIRHPF